jgi:hypothetical protein
MVRSLAVTGEKAIIPGAGPLIVEEVWVVCKTASLVRDFQCTRMSESDFVGNALSRAGVIASLPARC